jgi:hypothetical protein
VESLAAMDTHSEYTADWQEYRRRRRLFWILFLGFIPGVFILFTFALGLLSLIDASNPAVSIFLIAGFWMLMLIIASFQYFYFHCPRCHKPFFSKFWYRPFTKKCTHCGLPKWANSDPTLLVSPTLNADTAAEKAPDNSPSEPTEFVDANGNRATVAFWGSAEKARASLLTLIDCTKCIDCWQCELCFDCKRCKGCYHCAGCDECSDCKECGDCLRCIRCTNCDQTDERYGGNSSDWGCTVDCIDCSDCQGCLECSNCTGCVSCVRCSGCRDCERCTDCKGTSEISDVQGITKRPEASRHQR